MDTFRWVHLTDLHLGMRDDGLMANILPAFALRGNVVDWAKQRLASPRYIVKKSYQSTRVLELIAHACSMHPSAVVELVDGDDLFLLIDSCFGEAIETLVSTLIDRVWRWEAPFMQVLEEAIVSDAAHARLILRRRSAGLSESTAILADDSGHDADFYCALERVLGKWSHSPDSAMSELEHALGIPMRLWLRGMFFDVHIKQYSKSRRKAPIYWQLATPSASYSVWCYYHRLTRDTFFRVAKDYVMPKVDHEDRKLNALRQEARPDPSSKQRKATDVQATFVAELRAFTAEVARIAPLWNPNLNDGVIINFAPLWRLVPQHKPWQKDCKACWDKLVKGDYDWAHLAMHLWPERVIPKCKDDRSLAIAHGLEDEFWYEDDDDKWQKRLISSNRVEELVADRASTAVKAALKDLLEAPAPAGQTRRKRRAKA